MKVAVCVSGACRSRGNIARNMRILRSKFPYADFYFATWDTYKGTFEKHLPNAKCMYFPEPTIDYHPCMDIRPEDQVSPYGRAWIEGCLLNCPEAIEWSSHHTKQMLIHFWLADTIKDKYDVIVRTRFDVIFSKKAKFWHDVVDTMDNQRANGWYNAEKNIDITYQYPTHFKGAFHATWLVDGLIIHPASFVNVELVERLTREKKLIGGEMGWYQLLSQPYGSNHRSHEGWVDRW